MLQVVEDKNIGMLKVKASDKLSQLIEDAVNGNHNVLLLLSGGSALSVSELISEKAITASVTIGMLDERFSRDPAINNFLQYKNTTEYIRAKSHGVLFIDSVPQEHEDLHGFADRMDNIWKAWRESNPKGSIIALQGVGPDGHTAGIMPYAHASLEEKNEFLSLFVDTSAWCVGYDAGNKNQYPLRATASLTFLEKEVDESVIYVVGEEKTDAIRHILATEGSLSDTPARILHDMKSATLFITQLIG